MEELKLNVKLNGPILHKERRKDDDDEEEEEEKEEEEEEMLLCTLENEEKECPEVSENFI